VDRALFKLIFFLVLIIAWAIHKAWIEPRKKRYEEERRRNRTSPPPEAEEEEPGDGLKLPYEDLVDEVFGPYMKRRREAARPKPPPPAAAPPAPAPQAAPPPEPAPAPAQAPPPVETHAGPAFPPGAVGGPAGGRSIDERLFRNPSFSAAAKLVIAAEILRPPRFLRGRTGAPRR
jgi:hypothetical protein